MRICPNSGPLDKVQQTEMSPLRGKNATRLKKQTTGSIIFRANKQDFGLVCRSGAGRWEAGLQRS